MEREVEVGACVGSCWRRQAQARGPTTAAVALLLRFNGRWEVPWLRTLVGLATTAATVLLGSTAEGTHHARARAGPGLTAADTLS